MSQSGLADKLGLDKTTVSGWVSGKFAPRWWLVPKVAAALGVTEAELNSPSSVA